MLGERLDWNDLRFFVAVARGGSTLAASKRLRVSQATVSRRITLLEETVGTELFVRRPSGYTLSQQGRAMLPAAEAVEAAVNQFCATLAAESRRLSGQVRLTTVESAANAWVFPALRRLRASHPDIAVEIITTEANLDLARGEADVAIRFGRRPTHEALVAQHLADLHECFYAHSELVAQLGPPTDYADLARYPLIADSLQRGGVVSGWIAANVPEARIVHRVNTLSGLLSSVRAGLGAAVLPCVMGDDLRNIVRLMPPIEALSTPCWMVTTDAARRQPHIRAVIDSTVEHVARTFAPSPVPRVA
jgi:DNA-binding transcriptional LysR family regulator